MAPYFQERERKARQRGKRTKMVSIFWPRSPVGRWTRSFMEWSASSSIHRLRVSGVQRRRNPQRLQSVSALFALPLIPIQLLSCSNAGSSGAVKTILILQCSLSLVPMECSKEEMRKREVARRFTGEYHNDTGHGRVMLTHSLTHSLTAQQSLKNQTHSLTRSAADTAESNSLTHSAADRAETYSLTHSRQDRDILAYSQRTRQSHNHSEDTATSEVNTRTHARAEDRGVAPHSCSRHYITASQQEGPSC